MKGSLASFLASFALLISAGSLYLILSAGLVSADTSWFKTGANLLNSVSGNNGGKTDSAAAGNPSLPQITDAFKEALTIASKAVVDQVGATDGFNKDDAIHIPLPGSLKKVKSVLGTVGLSSMADDLELKMNRAAEAAAPKAKNLFLTAIKEMTFDDVKTIYDGPDDSATQYFKDKMTQPLSDEMRPIVKGTLEQVGAVKTYDQLMGKYKDIPFVPDVNANLTQHVLDKGLEGIFYYMAQKEASIRENPLEQTTDLLKTVFGR